MAGGTRPESGQAGDSTFVASLPPWLLVLCIAALSHTQRALVYRMQHHLDLDEDDEAVECMARYNALDDSIAEARQAIKQREVPACQP